MNSPELLSAARESVHGLEQERFSAVSPITSGWVRLKHWIISTICIWLPRSISYTSFELIPSTSSCGKKIASFFIRGGFFLFRKKLLSRFPVSQSIALCSRQCIHKLDISLQSRKFRLPDKSQHCEQHSANRDEISVATPATYGARESADPSL